MTMEIVRRADTLTEAAAWRMIEAAREQAQKLGIAVNIAVVDAGAELLAFSRMDGAPLLSGEIARNKAYTAVAFGRPTADWYPMIANEPALLHGIVHTPRLIIFGGGLPVRVNGAVVGGIGVSGGSAEQDVACAQAGLQAIGASAE
jgi:glc operon protein GlcG